MTGRLRSVGRWVSDWRTGAVVVASVLVALLAVIVVDSIQSRRASDARTDRALNELEVTVQELQRRGIRIDDLAAQLDQATQSRDRLSEEVRALRELLIDAGMLEPRPKATGESPPRQGSDASSGANRSPRPAPQPSRPTPRPSPTATATPTPPPGPPPYCALPLPILCP